MASRRFSFARRPFTPTTKRPAYLHDPSCIPGQLMVMLETALLFCAIIMFFKKECPHGCYQSS